MEDNKKEVTQVHKNVESSKRAADLYSMVYDNLHNIADKLYRRELSGHTLQPSLLVNEAYINLVDQEHIDWKGRSHFFAVGAQAIRRILVHHARNKNAQMRDSEAQKIDLREGLTYAPEKDKVVLSLDG